MARSLLRRALKLLFLGVLLLIATALVLGLTAQWWSTRGGSDGPAAEEALPAQALPVAEPSVPPPPSAGREPRDPDSFLLSVAQRIQGDSRLEDCGPYRLVSDVLGDRGKELCRRLAEDLDSTFSGLYGISPRGRPREGVFLFADREDFRTFARQDGRLRIGYGGYANGAHGFVALPWQQGDPQAVATTLAHELTHLVLRRALGPGLPPWLAEGLADGIGDSATPQGLQPIQGLVGVEGQGRRLRDAYRQGLVPSLERLVRLSREEFDRGPPSHPVPYDYEQSALFVRYLLASPERAAGFRAFLRQLAAGTSYRPELLSAHLGLSWPQLDAGFRRWIEDQS